MPVKSEPRKFSIGTIVMAKWPKTNLFYKGEIIDYNDIEYLVRFDEEGGSELAVKYKDVMLPFERMASRSRSRGRTPTRKSGGRSPGRKSPARKTSPNKRSPGRPPLSSQKKSQIERKSEVPVASSSRGRQPTRQSIRLANYEKTKDVSSSNNIKANVRAFTRAIEVRGSIKEWTKRFGKCLFHTLKAVPAVAFVIIIPFLLNQMCTKSKCTILEVPEIPKKLQYYYDQKAAAIMAGFVATLLLLSYIPIGQVVKPKNGARVRCNGFVSLFLSVSLIPLLLKLEYNVVALYNLYRHFMVSSIVLGFVTSILLYAKAYYARRDTLNPKGKSGYFLPDLVEGRELYPRLGNIDIKFFLFRVAIITTAMINVIVFIKDVQSRLGAVSPTLLVACGLQLYHIIDWIWFENNFFTTYEYAKQGAGLFLCVAYLVTPYAMTIYPRYVFNFGTHIVEKIAPKKSENATALPLLKNTTTLPQDQVELGNVELSWYCLVAISALFLLGYVIARGSNSQKNAFRTNPSNPRLSHLQSIPTSAGQRLLVSGWWGFIRHPNYLGDILIQLSWALLCGFNHAIPWIMFAISFLYLSIRTYLVESDCKKKYGLAWDSYTARVKHRLIPKVF